MKSMEINIDDRNARVELIEHEGSVFKISVDGKIYDADILMVERGVFSVLLKGKSYNVELIGAGGPKKYNVNTLYHSYDVEVVDGYTVRSLKQKSFYTGIENPQDIIVSSEKID